MSGDMATWLVPLLVSALVSALGFAGGYGALRQRVTSQQSQLDSLRDDRMEWQQFITRTEVRLAEIQKDIAWIRIQLEGGRDGDI